VTFGLAAPPGAGPSAGTVRTAAPQIPCAVFAGHYCAKIFFTSVSGGIRVN